MQAASRFHTDRAREFEQQDQLEAALGEYKQASEYDPSNRLAVSKVAELERTMRRLSPEGAASFSWLADALVARPPILILDEATSAVDTETEKEIQKALDNLVQGRTTIAIAHRLSTLRKADRLIVLDRGQIIEEGSHDELMIKNGTYRRMVETQARQEAEDKASAMSAFGGNHDE